MMTAAGLELVPTSSTLSSSGNPTDAAPFNKVVLILDAGIVLAMIVSLKLPSRR